MEDEDEDEGEGEDSCEGTHRPVVTSSAFFLTN